MARPVTLFTGQWADLPIAEMARMTADFGYDGIELACWGDHFEVQRALSEDDYCDNHRKLLDNAGLQCHAISAHLVGQGVLDIICLLYTSPSPRDKRQSRMPSSA